VTAGWAASVTRGRSLLDRTVGLDGARFIAAAPSWAEARSALAATPYGRDLAADAGRAEARRVAAASTVWHFRVLAGWLPPGGAGLARLAVAPVEISNIEGHLARLSGSDGEQAVPLGSLAVAWPRVSAAANEADVRSVLSRSAWGDPGGTDAVSIAAGLRIAWARRVRGAAELARPWAMGGLALVVARERWAFDRDINDAAAHELDRLLSRHWRAATSVPDLADRLPRSASWVLADVDTPDELWRCELALLRRVVADSSPVAAAGRYSAATVVAIAALLLVDLTRVTAAIEVAASEPSRIEVFDAVAA